MLELARVLINAIVLFQNAENLSNSEPIDWNFRTKLKDLLLVWKIKE